MPTFTIQLPDGRTMDAEAPDEATALQGAQQWHAANPIQIGVGEDLLKTAPAAVGRLAASTVGGFGDVRQLAGMGADALGIPQGVQNAAKAVTRGIPGIGMALAGGPTTEQVQGKLEGITGKLYEPQTPAGKVLDTSIQFAPALIGGPEALAVKAGTRVLAPAAASEAAGALTGDNPYVKAGTAVAASALAHRVTQPRSKPMTLTEDDLRAATQEKYDDVHKLGLEIKPGSGVIVGHQIENKLIADGATTRNAKPVHDAIRAELIDVPLNQPITTQKFDALRKELVAATRSSDGTIRHAAGTAIRELDNYLATLPQSHVIKGDAKAAAQLFSEARDSFKATKRLEMVGGKMDLGELNAQTAHSGQNIDNAMRQAIKQLIRPDKFGKTMAEKQGFNAAEITKMREIAKGSSLGNITRALGNMAGGGLGVAVPVVAGAAAYHYGPEGAAVPLAGFGLKKFGNALTMRKVRQLERMVGDRSPLGRALNRPPPQGLLSGLDRDLLNAAVAGRTFLGR